MSSWINYNGEIISISTAKFGFDHAAIRFSEILEERIRLFEEEFLFAEKHYFHLMAQMRMARMFIPLKFTPEFFYEALQLLQNKIGEKHGEFIFNVTQQDSETFFWVSSTTLNHGSLLVSDTYEIELYRESHVDNSFLNRINFARPHHRVLKIYAEENHINDLILLNNQKSIAHSIYGNIFMIKDTQLITPSLDSGAYDDVLRDRVIAACKRMPHFDKVVEEELFPFKLTKADEVFIVKNGQGIISVSQFRKTSYSHEVVPEIINFLLEIS